MIERVMELFRHSEPPPVKTGESVRNIQVDLERERVARERLDRSVMKATEVRENWMAAELRQARERRHD